jgi:hypothetical protein
MAGDVRRHLLSKIGGADRGPMPVKLEAQVAVPADNPRAAASSSACWSFRPVISVLTVRIPPKEERNRARKADLELAYSLTPVSALRTPLSLPK